MNKFDIELCLNLDPNLWYNTLFDDPNDPTGKIRSKGLRDPFRENIFRILQTLSDRFKGIAITDFGPNSLEAEDYNFKIIFYDFNNSDSYDLIADIITQIFGVSELVKSLTVCIYTSRGDSFYQAYLPELYLKHSGRIPFHEILSTQFQLATKSFISFVETNLRNSLSKIGLTNLVSTAPPFIIKVMNS